jgi:uncharacterized membrane protein YkgB
MSSNPETVPSGEANSAATALRRYLMFRILSLIAALLTLASVVLVFSLKSSMAGVVGSLIAAAVFFVSFQILHLKRRAWFKRWLNLKA